MIGQGFVVVGVPSRDTVARDGVRHSAADRTRVRHVPPSPGDATRAS